MEGVCGRTKNSKEGMDRRGRLEGNACGCQEKPGDTGNGINPLVIIIRGDRKVGTNALPSYTLVTHGTY